ncbi:MAG TPA: SDR family NAD(P)-dependent oxidoreductase [Solirubrobacteraceae bacterium]|nr:SDR family NAD(P)-dependent oxidoreductase [Solirubrobacteraceae bacterium]
MPSVLITGASRGIGRALALRLDAAGWDVYATVRRAEDAEQLLGDAANGKVKTLKVDVSDPEQIAALDAKLPQQLDGVVNNAGIVVGGPLESLSAEDLRHQMDVNVVGAVGITNAVLPKLRVSRGRVVFVSSLSGRVSTPMTGAYNASKFAIEAIADAWRVELAPWGVKVILVEPAMTDTDMWRQAPATLEAETQKMSDEHRDLYAKHLAGMRKMIPRMQRMAKPVEGVAAVIERVLTASKPRARYVVGTDVRIQSAMRAFVPTRVQDSASRLLTGIPKDA